MNDVELTPAVPQIFCDQTPMAMVRFGLTAQKTGAVEYGGIEVLDASASDQGRNSDS